MEVTIYVKLEWEEHFHEHYEPIQSALFECGCYKLNTWTWFASNNIFIDGYGVGNWSFTRVGLPRVNIGEFESKFKSLPALAKCSFIYRDED